MKSHKVRDFMVPLSEYATVSEDATLFEAVMALEKAQAAFDQTRDRHRALLVLNHDKQVIGKISQLDVLKALEPKYEQLMKREGLAHSGLTKEFIKSLMANYDLWSSAMSDICRKAAALKVKEFMYEPTEGEHVEEEATLNQAIHQLVLGKHQSLLVTRKSEIVGILRLSDVFAAICDAIKACGLKD
ncbi:MAG: CBS domain-containing protein [Deltaproteobacteria bacterium]|nr:CBS domain-containing protein [Deltaproteobacteria bacterium]